MSEEDFDDDDLEEDFDDESEDLDEELLPADTDVPFEDEELLEGALITLPELPEDAVAGLLTGAEEEDLLTCGLDGALLAEELLDGLV